MMKCFHISRLKMAKFKDCKNNIDEFINLVAAQKKKID